LSDHSRVMAVLRACEHNIDSAEYPRTVFLEHVESAGGREAFQYALVDGSRIDARRKIREIGERPIAARGHDRLHGLPANALECRQRVDDRVAVDFEIHRGTVDRWRVNLDAEPF